MQYCEIFDQIKATLEDYDSSVQRFDKLAFRSGNERVVQDIALRIRKILLAQDLVVKEDDRGGAVSDSNISCNTGPSNCSSSCKLSPRSPEQQAELRKVFVFLLLNTNIEYAHDLGDFNNCICHILRICPLLPRFVFVEVAWACALDTSYYELLTYAPPWLSYQHFEDAADSLAYIGDPYEVLARIEQIVCAGLKAITLADGRSDGVNSEGECYNNTQLLHVQLYNCVTKLMLHFDPMKGQAAKLYKKKRALKRFKGYSMRHLLVMCLQGLVLLETPSVKVPAECALYASCGATQVLSARAKRKQQDPISAPQCVQMELLLKLIVHLLNTLQNCAMDVDVDTYIDWIEIDAVDVVDVSNLQEHVGALAFELLERLDAVTPKPLKHDVCAQLKQFAAKPINFETRMEQCNLGELLNMLDAAKLPIPQQQICMNVLFKRFSIIYGNEECLETISNCAHLLTIDHCVQIMHYIKEDIARVEAHTSNANVNVSDNNGHPNNESDDSEVEDYCTLITILQKVFMRLTPLLKLQLLIAREQELGLSIRGNTLNFELPNYLQRSNVYWNTFVRRNFDPKKFLDFCFENSRDFWQRFFLVALENVRMVKPYLTACNATRAYAKHYQQVNMLTALGCKSQVKSANFSEVFFGLYFHNYRDNERVAMLKHVLIKINRHLRAARYTVVYELIKLLEQLSEHSRRRQMKRFAFGMHTCHVILSVANVMNQTRWNIHNFSQERAQVVAACRSFLEGNVGKYARKVHPMTRKMLVQKIIGCNFSRFTAYYMQGLSSPKSRTFAQFVLPRLDNEFTDFTHYAKLILCCTEGEIYQIANNLDFRRHLFVVMSTISHIVIASNEQTLQENYTYFFDAFVVIIVRSLNVLECSSTHYLAIFERICELIMTPSHLHPRLLTACTELFVKIALLPNGKKAVLRRLRQMPLSSEKQVIMRHIIAIKNR